MSKTGALRNQRDTREIPLDQWIPFLAEFTQENRGAHARLEIVGPNTEIGYQVETEDKPFDGVSADIKDCERTVWVAFSSEGEDHIAHGIQGAATIWMLPAGDNTGPVLEIEADDGTKTILELREPEDYALPPAGT